MTDIGTLRYDALAKANAILDQIMPDIQRKIANQEKIDVGAIIRNTTPVIPITTLQIGSFVGPAAIAQANSVVQTPVIDEESEDDEGEEEARRWQSR